MANIFEIPVNARFFCYTSGVDMRKGINSLYGLIRSDEELVLLLPLFRPSSRGFGVYLRYKLNNWSFYARLCWSILVYARLNKQRPRRNNGRNDQNLEPHSTPGNYCNRLHDNVFQDLSVSSNFAVII